MLISCYQQIRPSCLPFCISPFNLTLRFQPRPIPDAAEERILPHETALVKVTVFYVAKYLSSLCTGARDLNTLKFMELQVSHRTSITILFEKNTLPAFQQLLPPH